MRTRSQQKKRNNSNDSGISSLSTKSASGSSRSRSKVKPIANNCRRSKRKLVVDLSPAKIEVLQDDAEDETVAETRENNGTIAVEAKNETSTVSTKNDIIPKDAQKETISKYAHDKTKLFDIPIVLSVSTSNSETCRVVNGNPLVVKPESYDTMNCVAVYESNLEQCDDDKEDFRDCNGERSDYEVDEDAYASTKHRKLRWIDLKDAFSNVISITSSHPVFNGSILQTVAEAKRDLDRKIVREPIVIPFESMLRRSVDDDLISLHPGDELLQNIFESPSIPQRKPVHQRISFNNSVPNVPKFASQPLIPREEQRKGERIRNQQETCNQTRILNNVLPSAAAPTSLIPLRTKQDVIPQPQRIPKAKIVLNNSTPHMPALIVPEAVSPFLYTKSQMGNQSLLDTQEVGINERTVTNQRISPTKRNNFNPIQQEVSPKRVFQIPTRPNTQNQVPRGSEATLHISNMTDKDVNGPSKSPLGNQPFLDTPQVGIHERTVMNQRISPTKRNNFNPIHQEVPAKRVCQIPKRSYNQNQVPQANEATLHNTDITDKDVNCTTKSPLGNQPFLETPQVGKYEREDIVTVGKPIEQFEQRRNCGTFVTNQKICPPERNICNPMSIQQEVPPKRVMQIPKRRLNQNQVSRGNEATLQWIDITNNGVHCSTKSLLGNQPLLDTPDVGIHERTGMVTVGKPTEQISAPKSLFEMPKRRCNQNQVPMGTDATLHCADMTDKNGYCSNQQDKRVFMPPKKGFPTFCKAYKSCRAQNCPYLHEMNTKLLVSSDHNGQREFCNQLFSGNKYVDDALHYLPEALDASNNHDLLIDIIPNILRNASQIDGASIKHIRNIVNTLEGTSNSFDSCVFRIVTRHYRDLNVSNMMLELIADQADIAQHWLVLDSVFESMRRSEHTLTSTATKKLLESALESSLSASQINKITAVFQSPMVDPSFVTVDVVSRLCRKVNYLMDSNETLAENRPKSSNNSRNSDNMGNFEEPIPQSPLEQLKDLLNTNRYQEAYQYFINTDIHELEAAETSSCIKRILDGLYRSKRPNFLTDCKDLILYLRHNNYDIYSMQSDNWNTFDFLNEYMDQQIPDWIEGRSDVTKDFHEFIADFHADVDLRLIRIVLMLIYRKTWSVVNLIKIMDCYNYFYHVDDWGDSINVNNLMTSLEMQMVIHVFFHKFLMSGKEPVSVRVSQSQLDNSMQLPPKYKYAQLLDHNLAIIKRLNKAFHYSVFTEHLGRYVRRKVIFAGSCKLILEKIRRSLPIN